MNASSSSSFDTATTTVEAASAAASAAVLDSGGSWKRRRQKKTRQRNILKKLSVAPSILHIKKQELLSLNEVYEVYFNVLNLILLSCKKIISPSWFFLVYIVRLLKAN